MNAHTERRLVAGPAGDLVCAIDSPEGAARGVALVCHPHPQFGGTLDNKVVATLARGFVQAGWRAVRFNFRGVGGSAGIWDEGRGEIDDARAVLAALRHDAGEPVALAGFSFGAYVASQLALEVAPAQLILVGPATQNFAVAPVLPSTLVVHGEADEVVPLAATLDWARPQGLPVVVVPGVGHFFHGRLAVLKALLLRHLGVQPA